MRFILVLLKRHAAASSASVLMLLMTSAACGAPEDYFQSWPQGAAPQEIGQRVAARFLDSPHMVWTEFGTLHYAEVATWYGALTYARDANNAALTQRLFERFDPFFADKQQLIPPINHVDHTVFGALPLELYIQSGHARYRSLGLAFADGQWDNPTAAGLTNQTRFWIDDMYMITAVQAQALRATGRSKYIDRTAKQMTVYLDRLQQPNGLFFHAPDAPFYWGRGNGWMAAGMTELLRSLPEAHPQRARTLEAYRRMMATLLRYQTDSGMWRQLIDHSDAWLESSSTGMFAFAFVTGVREGWLDAADYGPAARKAWLALVSYLDENADVREVCVGTGTKNDLQYYLDRARSTGDLHGQAPILGTASALMEEGGRD
jgi:rhamnogalacturonyl hydrolase YesR